MSSDNIKYSDFSFNFLKNEFNNDVLKVVDRTSIHQSLKNILLTMRGEKPFNRNFGTNIWKNLFEEMDSIEFLNLRQGIESQIKGFEPRVELTNITFDDSELDSNTLTIKLEFDIVSFNDNIAAVKDSMKISILKVR
jgi:phage baseplate assembly protein W